MPDKLQAIIKNKLLENFQSKSNFRRNLIEITSLCKPSQKPELENLIIYYSALLTTQLPVFEDTHKYKSNYLESIKALNLIYKKYKRPSCLVLIRIIDFQLSYIEGVYFIRKKTS